MSRSRYPTYHPRAGQRKMPARSENQNDKASQADAANPTPSIEREPSSTQSQLEMVRNFIDAEDMTAKVNMLPPTDAYIFVEMDMNNYDEMKKAYPTGLFLGGSNNPRHMVLAFLRTYPAKASEVIIVVHMMDNKDAHWIPRKTIEGLDFTYVDEQKTPQKIHLRYPFQALASKKNTDAARVELNTLIQYIFLDAQELDKVWAKTAKHPLDNLKRAVNRIVDVYENIFNGVANVPDPYTLQSILRPSRRSIRAPNKENAASSHTQTRVLEIQESSNNLRRARGHGEPPDNDSTAGSLDNSMRELSMTPQPKPRQALKRKRTQQDDDNDDVQSFLKHKRRLQEIAAKKARLEAEEATERRLYEQTIAKTAARLRQTITDEELVMAFMLEDEEELQEEAHGDD